MIFRKLIFICFISLFSVTGFAEDIQLAKLDKKFFSPEASIGVRDVLQKLDNRLSHYPLDHEAELLKALTFFKAGNIEKALDEINELIRKVPDFQLAYLLKGDLLMARFGETEDLGKSNLLASLLPALDKDKKEQLALLREEAQLRIRSLFNSKKKNILPRQILALGDSVKKALLVDKQSNRLYVFSRQQSGELVEEVTDYYITTGKLVGDKIEKGDLKTPEGVYFVTSWISPDKLPDKYGVGAFPVNYPNELDRKEGKTGYGIWLHGTDKGFYSRPPRDSEGCVVLTNIDLEALKSEIEPGKTPVVIAGQVDWVDYETWKKERESILATIENWRKDWSSLDVDKYLSHYSKEFWSASHNKNSWSARKRYLAKSKTFQKVELTDVSLLVYPKKKDLQQDIAVVRLHQNYISNNFKSDMYKRLYLARQGDDWKILYEGR